MQVRGLSLVIKLKMLTEKVCAMVCRAAGVLLELYSATWPVRCGLVLLPPDAVQRVKQSGASNPLSGTYTARADALPCMF